MPFPRVGCQTCKSRRIKCDATQPVCQRCAKSRRVCSQIEAGMFVHSENQYASGQQKRPRGPRSIAILHYDPSAIPQRPSEDSEALALSYYLSNHVRKPEDAPNILMGIGDDFLPLWSSTAKSPAVLEFAITSMALAAFSRTQKHPPSTAKAATVYDRLLQVLQVTISSLNRRNIDACLLAIFFMSRYENTIHQAGTDLKSKTPFAAALHGFLHIDGAMAILKFWSDCMSFHQPATNVIKHTRHWGIKSALLRNIVIPNWMLDGTLFGEVGLELEYYRILIQIADIRQRLSLLRGKVSALKHTVGELSMTANSMVKEAEDAEKALQSWMTSFSELSCQRRHSVVAWQAEGLMSSTVYSYSDPAISAIWIHYYSTKMLVNSTIMKILELKGPDSTAQSQYLGCLLRITTMAEDLASSLPFCLGKFQTRGTEGSLSCQDLTVIMKDVGVRPCMADLAVWPLTIISSLGDLQLRQKLWFRAQLATFGRMMGDKVLEVDDADHWFPL